MTLTHRKPDPGGHQNQNKNPESRKCPPARTRAR
eukprot:CAMPEP_0181224170 /NCGR_PEP_ID=MMETSP1096-20121128/30965_1 /TAXON_ID=156174 ORGANISM="Chrysochromulina ericina, Strain CCMP281" /NCGR_SAMPLE_ID=MMETSP1096 /ASSEMBLY_ACC=CAM_ASM_000453 /LENGTH=33 /DNA_ID= /DNA_START= /DNA_END= /DNA_ORIENTATION=